MKFRSLSGFLLQRSDGKRATASVVESLHGVTRKGFLAESAWEEFELESTKQLVDDDDPESGPPYLYPIVTRRSESRIVLLSRRKELVEYLLEKPTFNLESELEHLNVRVGSLIDHLLESGSIPSEGSLIPSFIYAKTPQYGERLRSLSLFGDDVTNTNLFSEYRPQMDVLTCGLRRQFGDEYMRISTDGSLQIKLKNDSAEVTRQLRQIEETLLFMRKYQFLESTSGRSV